MSDPMRRQIAEDLRQKIEAGELGSGGRSLPSSLTSGTRIIEAVDRAEGVVSYMDKVVGLKQAGWRERIAVRAPDFVFTVGETPGPIDNRAAS